MRASPSVVCSQEALPGGFKAGEKLFFLGRSQSWDDGDKMEHGQQGEVMGASKTNKGSLLLRFPGNKENVIAAVSQLSRESPVRALRLTRLGAGGKGAHGARHSPGSCAAQSSPTVEACLRRRKRF